MDEGVFLTRGTTSWMSFSEWETFLAGRDCALWHLQRGDGISSIRSCIRDPIQKHIITHLWSACLVCVLVMPAWHISLPPRKDCGRGRSGLAKAEHNVLA